MFRVAGMAGVPSARRRNEFRREREGREERRTGREREEKKDLFYSRIKIPIRTLSFAL